ncbi:putative periplasmic aspartyl protease [Acidisarcina polymorpha]|uniref:Putative periplasmic aspartyl protease n=1 Tax=Acidisarcina polymorpha TaxID=2211140 RepID=A0A2Z5FXF4_9BACT|nr:putative periplasmic aspartyl protease [Acidisarcina polymorpha]
MQAAAGADGAPLPSGSVSFMDGDRSLGSAVLDSEGKATYSVDALPLGEQKITAVYEGDDSHSASSSAPSTVNSLASGVPGFTLSASASSLKTPAGVPVSTVITATPENGFAQAVSLSCSGVPYASVTCVFTPAQVTPGIPSAAAPNGVPALSTLSLQSIAPSGALLKDPASWRNDRTTYAVVVPGILALVGLGLARKRGLPGRINSSLKMLGLLALLLSGGLGLGACSQRYSYFHRPPSANPGTPVGVYTVTVSGITGTGSTLSTGSVKLTLDITAN